MFKYLHTYNIYNKHIYQICCIHYPYVNIYYQKCIQHACLQNCKAKAKYYPYWIVYKLVKTKMISKHILFKHGWFLLSFQVFLVTHKPVMFKLGVFAVVKVLSNPVLSTAIFSQRISFFPACIINYLCEVLLWLATKITFLKFRSLVCCKLHLRHSSSLQKHSLYLICLQ